jgi:predicted DCC family thiol-disulfide oxidoreductase YuxK
MTDRPLLVFDGDCSFCRIWIDLWKQWTGDQINYAPYQEVGARFPQIQPDSFQRAVQLILPDGAVVSAANAVVRTLAFVRNYWWIFWAYQHIPGFAPTAEWFYRLVAAHRSFFYKVTVLLWGKRLEPSRYEITTRWFLRWLGVIYLIAFLSLEGQITGLVGSRGILPVSRFLEAVRAGYGAAPWLRVPTVFWLGSSDAVLKLVCFAGAIASVAVVIGVVRRFALTAAFVLYLALVSIGQAFLSFQWDFLLLEAGFLAIFLLPVFNRVWLLRWLLFRLMFLSGTAKLLSHDPTWRNLTALEFHYETQPLPTLAGWYFHHFPAGFQKASVVFMFFVELVVPFLMFAPRRIRFFAAAMTVALEAIIFLTGNYTFFNLLATALCLSLCDDALLRRFARSKPGGTRAPPARFQRGVTAGLSVFILLASGFELLEIFSGTMPRTAAVALNWIAPFGVVNTYGLFAVMTTARPEIIVEGSNDGQTWLEYGFKYKPDDLKRAPVWVQPYQPRLDWQMWFAALANYQSQRWFVNFMVRLLEGSPDVLALLKVNPFLSSPPQYVRARLYDYKFTTFAERRATRQWWRRELQGEYFPVVSLKR